MSGMEQGNATSTELGDTLSRWKERGADLDSVRVKGIVELNGVGHWNDCEGVSGGTPILNLGQLVGVVTCERCLEDETDLVEWGTGSLLEDVLQRGASCESVEDDLTEVTTVVDLPSAVRLARVLDAGRRAEGRALG